MKIFKILIVNALFLSCSANSVTIESATDYYNAEKYEKAYQHYRELANLGNPSAIYNIGVMYLRGEFFEKDEVTAYAWIELSVKSGFDGKKALKILGEKLSISQKTKASKIFSAINQEFGPEAIETAFLPTQDKISNRTFVAAKLASTTLPKYPRVEKRKMANGYVDIEFSIGRNGVTRYHHVLASSSKAFSKVALESLRRHAYYPATLDGKPVVEFGRKKRFTFWMGGKRIEQKDIDRVLEENRKKAEIGGGRDKYIYAYSLSLVESLYSSNTLDIDDSNPWFVSAAQDGNPFAKYELGRKMLYGNQCDVDDLKARTWLQAAATDGVSNAQVILGSEYLSGSRYKEDQDLGYHWLTKAAEKNNETAQMFLAWKLATNGSHSDSLKAKKFLDMVNHKKYVDKLSLYETKAAVFAAMGNFDKAEKWQRKTVKE